MKSRLLPLFVPLLLLVLISSCAPREPLQLEVGTFEPSGMDKQDFFDRYSQNKRDLSALSGRASVQVSEPGHSERVMVHFQSDRYESLLKLRNNLGIEGGRIYSNPDSVIIYNRLEDQVHKLSHDDAAWFYLNGISALNLIQILHPITSPDSIASLHENDEFFLVETVNGERHFIEREHYRLKRTEREVYHPEAYSRFHFERYAEMEGFWFPRRIQILSSDEKSNIFFVIRSLDVNPSQMDFDPDIPGDLEITRL